MSTLKFELRKRDKPPQQFWSVFYDTDSGKIISITPGPTQSLNCLIVPFSKVKDILAGQTSQHNFRVKFSKSIGVLDLVDESTEPALKSHLDWLNWLTHGESDNATAAILNVILFADSGIIRVEANRAWTTKLKEQLDKELASEQLPLYVTDEQDTHELFGNTTIALIEIIERGYWEGRLWTFMDHELVQTILYHDQRIRINIPPVADSLCFTRASIYYPYSAVTDNQTIISHSGAGKHISIFVKDRAVWAQSHYTTGSAVDSSDGNLVMALTCGDDPDYFHSWVVLPALMLRQEFPFKILDIWPYQTRPFAIYKASNIDIGVGLENPN